MTFISLNKGLDWILAKNMALASLSGVSLESMATIGVHWVEFYLLETPDYGYVD